MELQVQVVHKALKVMPVSQEPLVHKALREIPGLQVRRECLFLIS